MLIMTIDDLLNIIDDDESSQKAVDKARDLVLKDGYAKLYGIEVVDKEGGTYRTKVHATEQHITHSFVRHQLNRMKAVLPDECDVAEINLYVLDWTCSYCFECDISRCYPLIYNKRKP